MKVGALDGIYPGKHFQRMEQLQGLQGINRERMQLIQRNTRSLGGQIFASVSNEAAQETALIADQLQQRLQNGQKGQSDPLFGNEEEEPSTQSAALDILV